MGSDRYFGLDGLGDTGYHAPGPVDIEKQPAAVALIELSKKYRGTIFYQRLRP